MKKQVNTIKLRSVKDLFKSRKKIVLIGALFVLVILVCVWLKQDGKIEKDVLLKILPEKVDLHVKDVHYTEVGDPDSTWEINADSAKYVREDNLVFFNNIRIKLIMSDGRTFVMTGDEGCLCTDTKDIEVNGNVEVISDKGDRFITDHLNYCSSDKRIYTDGHVTMKNQQMEISGVGMSLSIKTKKVTLFSTVTAIIK